MGAQESKVSMAEANLSADEKLSLQSSFDAIALEKTRKCLKKDMHAQWSSVLQDDLSEWILDYLFKDGTDGVSFGTYISLYSKFVKGAIHDQVEIITSLITGTNDSRSVESSAIVKYVECIVSSYIKAHKKTPKFKSWELKLAETTDKHISQLADSIAREVICGSLFSGKDTYSVETTASKPLSYDDVEKWLQNSSKVVFMQTDLLLHIYRPEEEMYCKKGSLIPACVNVPSHLQMKSVLNSASLLLLNGALLPEFRNEWHFAFSTAVHGESFSKMLGCITKKGPTIIIVVDTGGHIFGGFAPVCWDLGPKFYGDDRSFLFSLSPKMGIYRPTGFNSHYMYLNIQQQTLPNGLGMGGQFEYFGLWLDAEFGDGKCSKTCTTFDSPPLSSQTDFKIQHVEVWAVGKPPPTPQELGERSSVLDGNHEAKALLSMAGKEEHSLGFREEKELDL